MSRYYMRGSISASWWVGDNCTNINGYDKYSSGGIAWRC